MPVAEVLIALVAAAGGAGLGRLGETHLLRRDLGPLATGLTVAGAAAAALTVGSHSTGSAAADLAWRFLLVAAFSTTAKHASPVGLLVAAACIAAMASDGTAWIGFAAIGLAAVGTTPIARAATGALFGAGALHSGWPGGGGRTAAAVAVLLAALLLTTDRRFATRAALVLGVVAAACGTATAVAAVALADDRAPARQAIDAGQTALDAARDGRSQEAASRFDEAERLLRSVRGSVRGWLATPARAVPVIGANLADVDELLSVAGDVAAQGAATSRTADVDRVSPRDGGVDLDALRHLGPPLLDLEHALAAARRRLGEIGSTWSIPAIQDRVDELATKTGRAHHDVRNARLAVDAVPALLGGDEDRRYFLAVMTPAELRGGGGFVGNWGIIDARRGRLALTQFARISTLYPVRAPYAVQVDPEYDARYVDAYDLGRYPQNVLASPDLPSSTLVAQQITRAAGVGPIDGMIVVDPFGIAALLQLTGPIEVAGWPEPLTADNVARILLFDQYVRFAGDDSRPDLLARTADEVFRRLTEGSTAPAATILRVLGEAAKGGHLQMASLHHQDEAALARTPLVHSLRPPVGDSIAVVGQNGAPSKLDYFVHRKVRYDLDLLPSGRAQGTVTVELTNQAPRSGLPADGYQDVHGGRPLGQDVQVVSLYTPLAVADVTLDGQPVEFLRSREKGHAVADRFVTLDPGASAIVRFHLSGTIPLRSGRYVLSLHHQPTATDDDVVVTLNGKTIFSGALAADVTVTARVG